MLCALSWFEFPHGWITLSYCFSWVFFPDHPYMLYEASKKLPDSFMSRLQTRFPATGDVADRWSRSGRWRVTTNMESLCQRPSDPVKCPSGRRTRKSTHIGSGQFRNRFHDSGLWARWPARQPLLNDVHKAAYLPLARGHRHWTRAQWRQGLFTDESIHVDGRLLAWRRTGEGFAQNCVQPVVQYRGGSVIMLEWHKWDREDISETGKTDFVHVQRKINGQRYYWSAATTHSPMYHGLGRGLYFKTAMHVHTERYWSMISSSTMESSGWRDQRVPPTSILLNSYGSSFKGTTTLASNTHRCVDRQVLRDWSTACADDALHASMPMLDISEWIHPKCDSLCFVWMSETMYGLLSFILYILWIWKMNTCIQITPQLQNTYAIYTIIHVICTQEYPIQSYAILKSQKYSKTQHTQLLLPGLVYLA